MTDYIKNQWFKKRKSIEQVEESCELAPKFDQNGLMPVVTTDIETGELLMQGYVNQEAFNLCIKTGEAVYYSRSRQCIWHKGKTSGLVQHIKEIRIDDDQDCLWLRVSVKGKASCHVGYRSCFYRKIPFGSDIKDKNNLELTFTEKEKVFDPTVVYKGQDNPTIL